MDGPIDALFGKGTLNYVHHGGMGDQAVPLTIRSAERRTVDGLEVVVFEGTFDQDFGRLRGVVVPDGDGSHVYFYSEFGGMAFVGTDRVVGEKSVVADLQQSPKREFRDIGPDYRVEKGEPYASAELRSS